jgi:hypothetical protein
MVNIGNQVNEIDYLPPPYRRTDRGSQHNECAYPINLPTQASMYMDDNMTYVQHSYG